MEKTVEILNNIEDGTLTKFAMLAESFKGFAEVKVLELKNTNIDQVTQEVVHSAQGFQIPKQNNTESGEIAVATKDNAAAQQDMSAQVLQAMTALNQTMKSVVSALGGNGDDLESIKRAITGTLSVKMKNANGG